MAMEEKLQKVEDAILPVCKCGKELQKCRVLEAWDGCGTVSCSECHSNIDIDDQSIYHCPDDKMSDIHPNGYDLCRLCANKQIMEVLQFRFMDSIEL